LWANCGEPASLIINDPNFENIWLAAYDGFIKLNVRPRNILPVFRYSEGWRTAVVSRFASNRISRPHELAESLDKTSDRLYSDVFELYFQNLNL